MVGGRVCVHSLGSNAVYAPLRAKAFGRPSMPAPTMVFAKLMTDDGIEADASPTDLMSSLCAVMLPACGNPCVAVRDTSIARQCLLAGCTVGIWRHLLGYMCVLGYGQIHGLTRVLWHVVVCKRIRGGRGTLSAVNHKDIACTILVAE